MLWTFNQPIAGNDGLDIYPDPGPCYTEADSSFSCNLGFAGKKSNERFNIIVAIVTAAQANEFAQVKAGLSETKTIPGINALSHADGPQVDMVSHIESTRTN